VPTYDAGSVTRILRAKGDDMPEMTPEETNREIAHLKSLKDSLSMQMRDVQSALDRFRVKCPTCRCRILPGDVCFCCADRAETEDDPAV
jgi:hypothetical protein